MRAVLWILPLLLFAWVAAGNVHSDEHLDRVQAPHGGQTRIAGPYHFELVVGGDEVSVYVTDHGDNPIDTGGGSAKVIITTGKKRYVVVLVPDGENVLKGTGEYKLGKSNTVSVMVTLPGEQPQRAKFNVKRTSASKAKQTSHTQ